MGCNVLENNLKKKEKETRGGPLVTRASERDETVADITYAKFKMRRLDLFWKRCAFTITISRFTEMITSRHSATLQPTSMAIARNAQFSQERVRP